MRLNLIICSEICFAVIKWKIFSSHGNEELRGTDFFHLEHRFILFQNILHIFLLPGYPIWMIGEHSLTQKKLLQQPQISFYLPFVGRGQ
ncbi:hypothetical protein GDO81_008609 [Engystomops pustulosus]|uniref:Uncharacterized protein n=1 Tax=Engystomops pustulosus TaxID=76066 RepID=A0AAV7CHQ9_ENGPU|nr:hypothetical protein GDO81_008609 [Engystomops pustulosus]